jgi:CheY-like chemotaxis protein
LIEDNTHDAELTVAILKGNDVDLIVDVANDGAEALDYIYRRGNYANRSAGEPQLVLLDLKMPRVTGLQVLQQIKSDKRFGPMPVVIFTSSREPQDVHNCYQSGANGYVVKPVDAKQFRMALQNLAAYWLSTNEPTWQ